MKFCPMNIFLFVLNIDSGSMSRKTQKGQWNNRDDLVLNVKMFLDQKNEFELE